MTAVWWLLACHLRGTASRSIGEGLGEPWDGLESTLGGIWDGSRRARAGAMIAYDAHGMCWAAHGPFGLTFSNFFVAPIYFDLRHIMENSLSGEAPKQICTQICTRPSPENEL